MAIVQPIIVDSSGTHEDTLWAAAYASVSIHSYHPDNPIWQEWLAGRFTKSVRRANAASINKILEVAYPYHRVYVDGSQAVAFPPMHEPFPKLIAKCQVSGTEFPRQGFGTPPTDGYVIAINPDVEMSTGKTAAQVAHANFAFHLRYPYIDQTSLKITDDRNVFDELTHMDVYSCKIHDAGFTEIEPNTLTCVSGIL